MKTTYRSAVSKEPSQKISTILYRTEMMHCYWNVSSVPVRCCHSTQPPTLYNIHKQNEWDCIMCGRVDPPHQNIGQWPISTDNINTLAKNGKVLMMANNTWLTKQGGVMVHVLFLHPVSLCVYANSYRPC